MGVDRRAAIEAAFESSGKTEETTTDPVVEPVVAPESTETSDAVTPVAAEKTEAPEPPVKTEEPETGTPRAGTDVEVSVSPTEVPKPPNSWRPAVREQWAKLPPEVRQEVLKRERETEVALSQSANARKFMQEFSGVVQPFEHLIRAQNSTPLAAVDNMMRTSAMLQTGTPVQKASMVAQIIKNFSIDVDTLANILQNQPVKDTGNPDLRRELAPVYDFMNEVRAAKKAREEQLSTKAQQAIEEVAAQPFFDDVREDIADILEMAARRGKAITLKAAYEQAVKMNPEISQILEQRNKANTQLDLTKSKQAAKSVAGAPRSATDGKPKNRREAIEQAWGKT